MGSMRIGRLAAVVIGLAVFVATPLAAGADRSRVSAPSPLAGTHAFVAGPAISSSINATAQAAISWRGGQIQASTGVVVRVFVSESLAPEASTPEGWAEFIAGLTHGPELSLLTTYIAPVGEVQQICGARALGCYVRNQMVAPAETASSVSPEEILRHEYGHHVAAHRLNPPWRAIDWGPKHWASSASICARAARNEVFPGDQGSNYARNPGEAWAEVYRLLDERRAGVFSGTWPIVAALFFPDDTALQAAERDVLAPWTRPTVHAFQRTFGQRTPRVWLIPVSTPLDGQLRLTVSLPRGGTHDVALIGPNRRTVIQRGQWVGQRAKRIETTVCGQRNLFLRVTQSGALGRVRASITTP
jgi:hypothetical protein